MIITNEYIIAELDTLVRNERLLEKLLQVCYWLLPRGLRDQGDQANGLGGGVRAVLRDQPGLLLRPGVLL